MRQLRGFRVVAAVTLAAFLFSACATTQVPPISSAGAGFQPERDEVRLWTDARAEEQKLRGKARVYDDPLLATYLEGLVRRLNPPGMADNPQLSYRVTVLEDPTLNAFAYPHGALYVHTGLLARMENEDQLATVLAHEMTHVENRHMLRYHRAARNRQIGFSIAALAAAVVLANEQGHAWEDGRWGRAAAVGVLAQVMVGLGLQLAFLAAVNGYGRDLEREADNGGFDKLRRAGYDTHESPRVYELLLEDRGRDLGKSEVFFFGSHPQLKERIENARTFNRSAPAAAAARSADSLAPDQFALRMRPVVRDDARLNLEAGRLLLAEDQLRRVLKLTPADASAQLLWGRLRAKQAEEAKTDDLRRNFRAESLAAFREVVRLQPERPEPYRELGLAAYRDGRRDEACRDFARYLELAPQAEDAARIRDYQLELRSGGHCAGTAP